MLKIYLARHGQDEDNAKGILNGRRNEPLTRLGVEQAQALAENVKASGLEFAAVYSSPLARAYKTAQIVTEALGVAKPVVLETLIERDFGDMTGRPQKDIERLCAPKILKADPVVYFLSPEGAETFPTLVQRGAKAIRWVEERHSNGNILLVAHGDLGKMIYAAYYGLEWQKVLVQFHFGNSELLLLAEDSPPEEAHVFTAKQHNS